MRRTVLAVDESGRYRGWDWVVRCYYADDVEPPKVPGELAIETVHQGDSSKDIEVSAASGRRDIGRVEAIPVRRGLTERTG